MHPKQEDEVKIQQLLNEIRRYAAATNQLTTLLLISLIAIPQLLIFALYHFFIPPFWVDVIYRIGIRMSRFLRPDPVLEVFYNYYPDFAKILDYRSQLIGLTSSIYHEEAQQLDMIIHKTLPKDEIYSDAIEKFLHHHQLFNSFYIAAIRVISANLIVASINNIGHDLWEHLYHDRGLLYVFTGANYFPVRNNSERITQQQRIQQLTTIRDRARLFTLFNRNIARLFILYIFLEYFVTGGPMQRALGQRHFWIDYIDVLIMKLTDFPGSVIVNYASSQIFEDIFSLYQFLSDKWFKPFDTLQVQLSQITDSVMQTGKYKWILSMGNERSDHYFYLVTSEKQKVKKLTDVTTHQILRELNISLKHAGIITLTSSQNYSALHIPATTVVADSKPIISHLKNNISRLNSKTKNSSAIQREIQLLRNALGDDFSIYVNSMRNKDLLLSMELIVACPSNYPHVSELQSTLQSIFPNSTAHSIEAEKFSIYGTWELAKNAHEKLCIFMQLLSDKLEPDISSTSNEDIPEPDNEDNEIIVNPGNPKTLEKANGQRNFGRYDKRSAPTASGASMINASRKTSTSQYFRDLRVEFGQRNGINLFFDSATPKTSTVSLLEGAISKPKGTVYGVLAVSDKQCPFYKKHLACVQTGHVGTGAGLVRSTRVVNGTFKAELKTHPIGGGVGDTRVHHSATLFGRITRGSLSAKPELYLFGEVVEKAHSKRAKST